MNRTLWDGEELSVASTGTLLDVPYAFLMAVARAGQSRDAEDQSCWRSFRKGHSDTLQALALSSRACR